MVRNQTNGFTLGLDIGIGSVGVAIIDNQTGGILKAHSHIFSAINPENNQERRDSRHARRTKRRKQHRVKRVGDLFTQNDVDVNTQNMNIDVYGARVRGLHEELSDDELYGVLRQLVKHRGITYLDDAEDDSNGGTDYKQAVLHNQKLLQNETPGQILYNRLKQFGQVRGDFTVQVNGELERLMNVFSTKSYVDEARRLLQCQQEYHSYVTDEFIEAYLMILSTRRKYYHGPGSEKSRTDYGRFKLDGTNLENLFGVLIGKCSVYPDEYRAAKASYTAQTYNLLNDLNNLVVPTETKKLSKEQKEAILDYARTTKPLGAAKLFKQIAKVVGCSVNDIKGFRVTKQGKPDIHTYEAYRALNDLEACGVNKMSADELDKLAYVLTLNTDLEGILDGLRLQFPDKLFDLEDVEVLAQFRKKQASKFSGWHSFSLKCMQELIPELLETSKEQMTILTERGLIGKKETSPRTKYIDIELAVKDIVNPAVQKAVKQALLIVNEAVKKYGFFDNIVIEMARETNEKDERDAILKSQRANELENKVALTKAAQLRGRDLEGYEDKGSTREKIRLWYQQGGKCLYTGREINIFDLIEDPFAYEVDHIIPLSISFDDSLTNKVVVYRSANQEKGQATPYMAMSQMVGWSYENMKAYILDKSNKDLHLSPRKIENLLFEEDIFDQHVRQGFVSRNLVDTRYSCKTVLNNLQTFYRNREIPTRVSVIRGSFTAQLRRHWHIYKSRETYHHHAVDALVIAASSQLRLWKKMNEGVDLTTGEIISNITVDDPVYEDLVFRGPYQKFVETLRSSALHDFITFSHQVDKKPNRKLSDDTLYGTRELKLDSAKDSARYIITSTGDLYSDTGYAKFKKVYEKDKSKFLAYQHDAKTFETVIDPLVKSYPETILNDKGKSVDLNPFAAYLAENGELVRTRINGGNPIKQLKYADKKLGEYLDVTQAEGHELSVKLSLKFYRCDVFFNPETKRNEFLVVKHADLRLKGDKYVVPEEHYQELKEKCGVARDSIYRFPLYTNDIIQLTHMETGETQRFRFIGHEYNGQTKLRPVSSFNFEPVGSAVDMHFMGWMSNVSGISARVLSASYLKLTKVHMNYIGNIYKIE